jgi:hypothetical protein
MPGDGWNAWIEARYVLADLRFAVTRLELSPATKDDLGAAINRAAQELSMRQRRLEQSSPPQINSEVEMITLRSGSVA